MKAPHQMDMVILSMSFTLIYRRDYLLLQSSCYILKTLRAGVVLIPDHSPAQGGTQCDKSRAATHEFTCLFPRKNSHSSLFNIF